MSGQKSVVDIVDSSQHLKDLKIAIEFKYLMKHAPGGVYLLPEFDNIRTLHGAIFVRRGLYRNGIFRFVLKLQKAYNALNAHPEITFTPPVFNPLIHPQTGVLDITCDTSMQEWKPDTHFIVHALGFLKKIFYVKTFDEFTSIANDHAFKLLETDKEKYIQRVEECIAWSQTHIYDIPSNPACPLIFTEDKQAHISLRDSIIEKANAGAGSYASPLRDALLENSADDSMSKVASSDEKEDNTTAVDRLVPENK
jgi:ubiquitin-protein ligase